MTYHEFQNDFHITNYYGMIMKVNIIFYYFVLQFKFNLLKNRSKLLEFKFTYKIF